MSVTDSPDWQNVVTVVSGGAVTDAPDWSEVVTGPGATPIPVATGGTTSIYLGGGILGISMDPVVVTNIEGHLEGAIAFMGFTPFATGTVNNIFVPIGTSSGGFTPNQNFVGIYDMGLTTGGTFTLLASSAAGACDTPFATAGMHQVALTTGAKVNQGSYYALAFLQNGTPGNFYSFNAGTAAIDNPNGTTWPVRCVTIATTHTTLSSTIAFSACNTSGATWLFYASI